MTAILIALAFAALTAMTALGIMAVIHHINWYAVTVIFLVTFCVDIVALGLCRAASRQNPE